MQYNEKQYNASQYNFTTFSVNLAETLTTNDGTKTVDASVLRAEVVTLVDLLQKLLNQQPLLDEVILMDATLANMPIKNLADSMGLTDAKVIAFIKSLPETVTLADIRTMAQSTNFVDFVLLVDELTKQITDKRISDAVRLQDWLNVKKNPAAGIWSD